MVRIIGIDPGLQHTGWAVIDSTSNSIKFIAAGVIHTKPDREMADRLLIIHKELSQTIEQYTPQLSSIENTYVNKNSASSLKLAHARAAAILTLSIHGLNPKEYQAKVIKRAITGTGSADKLQVEYMLKQIMPICQTLNSDAFDALAVAVCHGNYQAAS